MILIQFLLISYFLKVSNQIESNNFDFLLKNSSEGLRITDYIVGSFIKNRYLESTYIIKVINEGTVSSGTSFFVVLPGKGFVTSFTININGKSYPAVIKSKWEVDKLYEHPMNNPEVAPIVSTRNSIVVSTDAIVEPKNSAVFQLVFEQLLERKNGRYEILTNIQPGQFVENLNVSITILESDPLSSVKVHPLRSGRSTLDNPDLKANILKQVEGNTAHINFNPDLKSQFNFSCSGLGYKNFDGFAGQLIVDYDVERDFSGGSLFYQDGYFVNFFAPNSTSLEPLKKHIVFVLDTSDSMRKGNKLAKLKEALNDALSNLQSDDLFNIVEYSEDVYLWNIQKKNNQKVAHKNVDYRDLDASFENLRVDPWTASKENVANAKEIVNNLQVRDATNIILSLELGLFILKIQHFKNPDYIPLLIFLTDGTPTAGIKKSKDILSKVTKDNFHKSMIFSLSFGEDANKQFLKELALRNFGNHYHIYDDIDSVDLFKDFFKSIEKPLLSNVEFLNVPSNSKVTKTKFPALFEGSELVLVGSTKNKPNIKIKAKAKKDLQELEPKLKVPLRKLEKVWAFATLKHLLEMQHIENNDEKKKELLDYALEIALNYSFVSEISFLVYTGPNGLVVVSTKDGFVNGISEKRNIDLCSTKNMEILVLKENAANLTEIKSVLTSFKATEIEVEIPTTMETSTTSKTTHLVEITSRKPKSCKESRYGCCKDGTFEALGPNYQGCEEPDPSSKSCSLKVHPGRICLRSKFRTQWYFDVIQGKCVQFQYKGCGGNSHRFGSLEMCQKYCENVTSKDRCILPKSSGTGTANLTKWYYDFKLRKCSQFEYFGTGGNTNRFEDYDSCGLECEVEHVYRPHPEQQEKCFFDNKDTEIGCLNHNSTYFYYNKLTGKCLEFQSGPGCKNHHNRFRNVDNCERTCINPSRERICYLPVVKGSCKEQIAKFYFDKDKKDCYLFNYSGCNGNANQFSSKLECLQECARVINNDSLQDICSLPTDFGDCGQKTVKWYYSFKSGQCIQYNYGGCNDHSNKFNSKSECENICIKPKGREICNLSKVKGPCNSGIKRWYFDKKSKTCKDFIYGGCNGNANNFAFSVDCVKQCGGQFL